MKYKKRKHKKIEKKINIIKLHHSFVFVRFVFRISSSHAPKDFMNKFVNVYPIS